MPIATYEITYPMYNPIYIDEETKAEWRDAFEQARADRETYFNWLKNEINHAIDLINRYDKIYVLGGLGARLLQASPTFYNQVLETYEGPDKENAEKEKILEDDEIEVLLEYALSIASASPNTNEGKIPTAENIEEIREQLSKIKFNIGFYEMSAEDPSGGNQFNHWLKMRVMEEALHVRGPGYYSHILEIYRETFAPHDGFLSQYYGFNSADIYDAIKRLDVLVASKIGNAFGGGATHQRFLEWNEEKGDEAVMKEMTTSGKHFMRQFIDDNPDLQDEDADGPVLLPLDYIGGYSRMFWVHPKNEKEKKIFHLLSHQLGDNAVFVQGKFGGFPLGDTIIQTKPLLRIGEKYYCFSISLPFRNLFNIAANLLQTADSVYYEAKFKNNVSAISRDNYIEAKVKSLFEKLLPSVRFYHSLDYNIVENGLAKKPELDILGIGGDTLYVVEVKAGELNKKHRRGAILGLKDRLKETINEGSYQCHRAEKFINDNESPKFQYTDGGQRKWLIIDKTKDYEVIKISVTYEHFSTVAVNLKYLIESGVLSPAYKWAWIVSLFDLMVFADLIESETDFKEYLQHRFLLYERNDIEFHDELDILCFFFNDGFPLQAEKEGIYINMFSFRDEIDTYYTRKDLAVPGIHKPIRKR
jgi:hypothetical protein